MSRNWTCFGLLALILAGVAGFAQPGAAEFFGCNDTRGQVLSYDGRPVRHSNSRYTHEFAAQSSRPRVTYYPRRDNRRYSTRWR